METPGGSSPDKNQLFDAKHYRGIIVAYANGAPLRVEDVAEVRDAVEDIRTDGLAEGKHGISIQIYRVPGANMVATVDRVRAILPLLRTSIPRSAELTVGTDRTATIRASVKDVQRSLC